MRALDKVDRKIISCLIKNGRMTLKELSNETNYTVMGVKKRVDRLLKEGLLKISASVNLDLLRWIPIMVFLDVKDRNSMDSIIERFRRCPRIIWFFYALGSYNLIALIVAEDYKTLHCISSEGCSFRNLEGVARVEYFPLGGILYEPYLPIRLHLVGGGEEKPPCGVECKPCKSYIEGKCVGCPATIYYRVKS